jgi:anti-sigma factor RsiW
MIGPRRVSEAELHAFVDEELAPRERAELELMIAAAPADLEAARELNGLNEAIKQRYSSALGEPMPRRLQKAIAQFEGRSAPVRRRLTKWAAAAVLLLAAGAAGYLLHDQWAEPRGPETAFVTTALGAHTVFVPEVRHPVEVKADEAHLVRWLTKRVGADVRAPALGNLGWQLMGGRLLPDQDGLPAAQFMYEDTTGRRLTLYMRKETGLNNTSFRFHEREGLGSFYWIDRPLAYALSGRLSREELIVLATAVYGQLDEKDSSKVPADRPRAQ